MVLLELGRAEQYEKALSVACDLARQYNSPITIMGLPAQEPDGNGSEGAASADELDRFAAEQMTRRGVYMRAKAMPNGNGDLRGVLDEQIWSAGVDLVLIASPLSINADHAVFKAAQHLVAQSHASVFLIR